MATSDMLLLVFIVAVFATFGGTLAFASWDESRRTRKAKQ